MDNSAPERERKITNEVGSQDPLILQIDKVPLGAVALHRVSDLAERARIQYLKNIRRVPYPEAENRIFLRESYDQAFEKLRRSNRLNRLSMNTLKEIAESGSLDGQQITLVPDNEWGGRSNYQRDWVYARAALLALYSQNQDFAKDMVSAEVIGMHGSRSASLIGVLNHGLKPQDFLIEAGELIVEGEGIWGSADLNREHVSFYRWFDDRGIYNHTRQLGKISEDYLEAKIAHYEQELVESPEHLYSVSIRRTIEQSKNALLFLKKPAKTYKEQLHDILIRQNFPVLYFVDGKTFNTKKDVKSTIDQDEFAVRGGVNLPGIKIIAVPRNRLTLVSEQIRQRGLRIRVYPLEDFLQDRR